jgi:CRP/FNR family transcriptional regulator, anaerobic regulatory protein
MHQQILHIFNSIVKLSPSDEATFIKILELKKLKKKEFLLKEGQVCNKITFINAGCFRLFYNIDGEENNIQFFFENSFHTDYNSFLTGEPSLENMQALEPCEIVQFKKSDLYKLYETNPIFEKIGRIMAENAFLSVTKLNKMLTNEEPEQRYLSLLKHRPELVNRVPQHFIASYLGIKPESLSRIRKRILTKK